MWKSKRGRRCRDTKELMQLAYTPKGETANRKNVYRYKYIWEKNNGNSIFVKIKQKP